MKLKPYKELIAMSKEKLDAALAPVRARQVKTQAELAMAKIDEQLISTEAAIQELCAQKQIDFSRLLRLMDDVQELFAQKQIDFSRLLRLMDDVQELCAQKQIDFSRLLRLMDDVALAERRKKQYGRILNELFPEDE